MRERERGGGHCCYSHFHHCSFPLRFLAPLRLSPSSCRDTSSCRGIRCFLSFGDGEKKRRLPRQHTLFHPPHPEGKKQRLPRQRTHTPPPRVGGGRGRKGKGGACAAQTEEEEGVDGVKGKRGELVPTGCCRTATTSGDDRGGAVCGRRRARTRLRACPARQP